MSATTNTCPACGNTNATADPCNTCAAEITRDIEALDTNAPQRYTSRVNAALQKQLEDELASARMTANLLVGIVKDIKEASGRGFVYDAEKLFTFAAILLKEQNRIWTIRECLECVEADGISSDAE